jgi:hypothetical protein
MEKLDQAVALLTLTMGLCLMWEGYTDLSEARKIAASPAHYDGAIQLSGFDVSSATVAGGDSIQATLTFNDFTPVNGAVVKVTAARPSAVSVSDVLVPAACRRWQVSIPTNPVAGAERVIVTASCGGVSKGVVVTLRPRGAFLPANMPEQPE